MGMAMVPVVAPPQKLFVFMASDTTESESKKIYFFNIREKNGGLYRHILIPGRFLREPALETIIIRNPNLLKLEIQWYQYSINEDFGLIVTGLTSTRKQINGNSVLSVSFIPTRFDSRTIRGLRVSTYGRCFGNRSGIIVQRQGVV